VSSRRHSRRNRSKFKFTRESTGGGRYEPKHTGKVEEVIELVVGMRAMVLLNIATEADLANGTRGEIVGIILDRRDEGVQMDAETGLTHDVQQSRRVKWKPVRIVCTFLFLARFPRFLDEGPCKQGDKYRHEVWSISLDNGSAVTRREFHHVHLNVNHSYVDSTSDFSIENT
jgi:hypothetical protein